MLTDLHPRIIFVDDDWHVMCLIDLEWACALPSEMLHPPYWLTNRAIDCMDDDENLAVYRERHGEFVAVLEKEEEQERLKRQERQGGRQITCSDDRLTISKTMRTGWTSGNSWLFSALNTFKGLYSLFIQHIQPRYGTPVEALDDFERLVAPYWAAAPGDGGSGNGVGVGEGGVLEFVQGKIKERERHLQKVRELFQQQGEGGGGGGKDEEVQERKVRWDGRAWHLTSRWTPSFGVESLKDEGEDGKC